MLGIIIGVAAVIIIVGLGNGMERYMTDSFKSLGTNLINVTIRGRGSARSISDEQMYQIEYNNPTLFDGLSPTINISATMKIGTDTLDETTATGVSEDYLNMKGDKLSSGRFIVYADNLTRSKVCVVGSYIAQQYFSGNALGQTIKFNGDFYEIVGVIDQIADSESGGSDDVIYLPYTTAAKMMGIGNITSYSFAMVSEDYVTEAKDAINTVLYGVFSSTDAYRINSMSEMLSTMTSMINIVVMVLSIIAGISLVVGGIGIMNIMLVSVSERTREIGIRKALGAKRRNILLQFIIEAGTTSAIGGIIGIIVGYLLSSVATVVLRVVLSENLTVAPAMWAVIMAFCVSAGIGILFGFLPARKAAYLNPIDALRYE